MSLAEPLSLSRLLDEAVRLARRHFTTIFLPVGVPVALAAALMSALQTSLTTNPLGGSDVPWVRLVAFGLALLFYLLAYLFGYAAMQAAAVHAAAGRPIDMGVAWRTLLDGRLVGTWIVAGLGIVAGMVCCVVPGIYLALLWAVVVPVVLEDRLAFNAALGRSAQLMRHNPGGLFGDHPMLHVFLLYFVAGLISYAVSLLVSIPMMAVVFFLAFRAGSAGGDAPPADDPMQGLMWIQVPTQFVSVLGQMAVQVFVTMGIALLYFDRRHRLEGDDLAAAVRSVGRGPEAPA